MSYNDLLGDDFFDPKVQPIDVLSTALARMLGFAEFDGYTMDMMTTSSTREHAESFSAGIAKYVIPMYLNDIIGATCYSCVENALSFNFPNCDKANNCVISRDSLDIDRRIDFLAPQIVDWEFRVDFNKVEMLDKLHVNPMTAQRVAAYAVDMDGFVRLFEDFTGIRIDKGYRNIDKWRDYGIVRPPDEYCFLPCDNSGRIKKDYEASKDKLYPAPKTVKVIKSDTGESPEDRKRRQLERIARLQRQAQNEVSAMKDAAEQERQRKVDEEKRKEDEKHRRLVEEERDYWKKYFPKDLNEWNDFFDKMMEWSFAGVRKCVYGHFSPEQTAYSNLRNRMYNRYTSYYFITDDTELRKTLLGLVKDWYREFEPIVRKLNRLLDEDTAEYHKAIKDFESRWH